MNAPRCFFLLHASVKLRFCIEFHISHYFRFYLFLYTQLNSYCTIRFNFVLLLLLCLLYFALLTKNLQIEHFVPCATIAYYKAYNCIIGCRATRKKNGSTISVTRRRSLTFLCSHNANHCRKSRPCCRLEEVYGKTIRCNRRVVGVLRGYDNFMNIVLDNTLEVKGQEKQEIGMVVIRGNSIVYWECLDKVK